MRVLVLASLFATVPCLAQDTVWNSYMVEGGRALNAGEYEKAGRLYRLACKEAEAVEPDDWQVASSLFGLGLALYYKGEIEGAEALYVRSIEIRRRIFGDKHIDVARVLSSLGLAYGRANRKDDAIRVLREALAIHEGLGDEKQTAGVMLNLSLVHSYFGEQAKAQELLSEAQRIYMRNVESDSADFAELLLVMANLYHDSGEHQKALEQLQEAEALFEKHAALGRLIEALQMHLQVAKEMGNESLSTRIEERIQSLAEKTK